MIKQEAGLFIIIMSLLNILSTDGNILTTNTNFKSDWLNNDTNNTCTTVLTRDDNLTLQILNQNETKLAKTSEIANWTHVLDKLTATLTITGLIMNVTSLVTLIANPRGFAPVILLLLRTQSFLDAVACLFSALLLLPPPMWRSGNAAFDAFICQVWHGQAFYWGWVWMTIGNLIYIAIDRYRCVCYPLKYFQHNMTTWYTAVAALPFISMLCTLGAYFQTRIENGKCESKFLFDGLLMKKLMLSFSVSTFLTFFLIPTIILIILYSRIIYTMRKRKLDPMAPYSRTFTKATRDITKTAIVVTIIFIIAMGYDLTYYLLGYAGAVKYIFNSPPQKIGVLFATFNNFANPIVYCAMMQKYRQNVIKTCLGCFWKNIFNDDQQSSTSGAKWHINIKNSESQESQL